MSHEIKNTVLFENFSIEEIQNRICPNNTIENAKKYLKSGFDNTYYLGYRDIPNLVKKYVNGKKTIDYGCGTGRSTQFLKALGLEVIGVDINYEMLSQATELDHSSHYLHIKNAQIPVLDSSYDFIFSCFVLLTIPTKKELFAIFREMYRSLKKGGIYITVTGSEELYSHDWLSYNVNYPENKSLTSGSLTKIQLKDLGLDFINYFWTDSDYEELFQASGLSLVEKHFTYGTLEDGKEWVSETKHPPYVVYVLRKE